MTMHTITGFIAHLEKAALLLMVHEHNALKKSAEVVEKEAKEEFGTYQGAIGQFDKWAELADSTKEDRLSKGFTENDPLLRTGKLRESISHEVEGLTAIIGSAEMVMVYQELGTEKIPPRPVLGPSLMRKEKQVLKLIGDHTASAFLFGTQFSHVGRLDR